MARRKRLNFEQLKSKAYDKSSFRDFKKKGQPSGYMYHSSGGYNHFWTDMYYFSQAIGTFDDFVKNPTWFEPFKPNGKTYCPDKAKKEIMRAYNYEFDRPKGNRPTHNQYGWIE